MALQAKSNKKFMPNRFKTNKKQSLPRPTLKNVDPFIRNSRHPNRLVRKARPYLTRRSAGRRRRIRHRRAKKFLLKRYRRFRRNPRMYRRFKP